MGPRRPHLPISQIFSEYFPRTGLRESGADPCVFAARLWCGQKFLQMSQSGQKEGNIAVPCSILSGMGTESSPGGQSTVKKRLYLLTNLDTILKRRHHFPDKGLFSQSYGFSYSQVRMWELDLKEGWAPKNLCFQTVVLEKTIESPLDCKEIKPVNSKGNQSWIIIGRTDAKAEAPKLWPPDGKSWLIGKDPDAGKDWRQEEKGMTEDEMVGWHHWLKEHEFEPTLRDREGQGNLACGSPWGHKESDMTERLSNNKSLLIIFYWRIAP